MELQSATVDSSELLNCSATTACSKKSFIEETNLQVTSFDIVFVIKGAFTEDFETKQVFKFPIEPEGQVLFIRAKPQRKSNPDHKAAH